MKHFQGLRLAIRAIRYRFKLNAPEIAEMARILPRDGVGIDVGGHKGAYSYWMARAVGKGGRVVVVEPQPEMVTGMRESFASPGAGVVSKNAVVVCAAASDSCGESAIKRRPTSSHGVTMETFEAGAAFEMLPVRLVTIDRLVSEQDLKRVDFVKIDVEGHEFAVLRGAFETLKKFGPAVLVECEARNHGVLDESHLVELAGMLGPLGYSGKFHDGDRWRALGEMRVSEHQTKGKGKFCNNILFVKGDGAG